MKKAAKRRLKSSPQQNIRRQEAKVQRREIQRDIREQKTIARLTAELTRRIVTADERLMSLSEFLKERWIDAQVGHNTRGDAARRALREPKTERVDNYTGVGETL